VLTHDTTLFVLVLVAISSEQREIEVSPIRRGKLLAWSSPQQRVPQREQDHNYSLRKGLSWMDDVLEDQPDRYYGSGRHHPGDRCSLEGCEGEVMDDCIVI
jgi:hypothetical protein